MQQQIELEVLPRPERGKNEARRLRLRGRLPAVMYGLGKESISLSIDTEQITRILQSPSGHNQILTVKVAGGETAAAMASDWQVDPVKGHLLHVDVLRVDLEKPVEVLVPVKTVGSSLGVREEGGVEELLRREVRVRALPLRVPEKIVVDVTNLELGQALRVGDLEPSEDYEVLTPAERIVVHVVTPKVVEEEEVAEEVEGELLEDAAVPAEEGADKDKEKDKEKDKGKGKGKDKGGEE